MTDTQNEVFKTPVNKIRLFEHGAPGSQNFKLTRKYYTEDMPDGRVKHIVQNITDPDIVPYIPDGIGNSTDRQRIPAVLIIPGGAFRRLVYNFEGEDVAKWLNSMGIAAFVLECRLPSDEHDNAEDVPLIDAMRAMRVIRGRAQEFGIDEAKALWAFQQEALWQRYYQQRMKVMCMRIISIRMNMINYQQDQILLFVHIRL